VRFHSKPYIKPPDNVTKSWFALWPVTIGLETRWLEWVTVDRSLVLWKSATMCFYYYANDRFVDGPPKTSMSFQPPEGQ
jgi:hypothetical protein